MHNCSRNAHIHHIGWPFTRPSWYSLLRSYSNLSSLTRVPQIITVLISFNTHRTIQSIYVKKFPLPKMGSSFEINQLILDNRSHLPTCNVQADAPNVYTPFCSCRRPALHRVQPNWIENICLNQPSHEPSHRYRWFTNITQILSFLLVWGITSPNRPPAHLGLHPQDPRHRRTLRPPSRRTWSEQPR